MRSTATTKLVIVGARSHAREVHDAVLAMNAVRPQWKFLGFVADGATQPQLIAERGSTILGGLEVFDSLDPNEAMYITGIGSPRDRKRIDEALTAKGFEAATIVHPTASIGTFVDLGAGCYVAAHAVVTTAVTLGRHVHINVHSSVSHDCVVGDYAIVNPGSRLTGGVRLGTGVDMGAGAVIIPKVTARSWSTIGAGAVVIRDVPESVTVVGVPARVLPPRT